MRYGYGEIGCGSSDQCASGTNMICTSNTCSCAYPSFWNGFSCRKSHIHTLLYFFIWNMLKCWFFF